MANESSHGRKGNRKNSPIDDELSWRKEAVWLAMPILALFSPAAAAAPERKSDAALLPTAAGGLTAIESGEAKLIDQPRLGRTLHHGRELAIAGGAAAAFLLIAA